MHWRWNSCLQIVTYKAIRVTEFPLISTHSIKYFINYNHKLKIILFTVEGSLWENGSRHMLQPSSKASWIPSSWKAETDAMRFSAFLTFSIPGTYKQSTQKKKKKSPLTDLFKQANWLGNEVRNWGKLEKQIYHQILNHISEIRFRETINRKSTTLFMNHETSTIHAINSPSQTNGTIFQNHPNQLRIPNTPVYFYSSSIANL